MFLFVQNAVTLLREAAKFEAEKFKHQEHRPPYFVLHKYELARLITEIICEWFFFVY